MSGGRFGYNQYQIKDIAESIERELFKMGKEIPKGEREWYFSETHYYDYPKEVKDQFKKAVRYLKVAYIFAQRVDWLLSGDDGDDTFLERLDSDLKEIGLSRDALPNF